MTDLTSGELYPHIRVHLGHATAVRVRFQLRAMNYSPIDYIFLPTHSRCRASPALVDELVVARAKDSEVRTRPFSLSVLEWVYPTTWEATIPAHRPLTITLAAGCSQVSKVCESGDVPLPA